MFRKLVNAIVLVLVIAMFFASFVYAAGSGNQPVEWISGSSNLRGSLKSLGQGWLVDNDKCDENDYVMVISKNFSADPDKFRVYSNDSAVQKALSGKSPIGYNLDGIQPYLCVGFRDTWNAGGPFKVADNAYIWVQP